MRGKLPMQSAETQASNVAATKTSLLCLPLQKWRKFSINVARDGKSLF